MAEQMRALNQFMASTAKSKAAFERASKYLEGGTTRTSIFYRPHPFYGDRGEGCWIYDIDGNRRLDFLNNFSALIHGHAHPGITEAVTRQLARGTALGAPTECEAQLAAILMDRVPSLERMRFCSSGTEAVMFALRLAKAFTGRVKIAKFEGGFHGAYDYAQVNVTPPPGTPENWQKPPLHLHSAGISPSIPSEMVILPFNDAETTEAMIDRHKDELAAVIIEPIQGAAGVIPAEEEFLRRLKQITAQNGIILIFDEIMSLRTAWGGAQEAYGVHPDLTTMGKIISGGFPLAALGGREDIMSLMDPREREPQLPHSGTFNAIPVCVVAGIAAMQDLTQDRYDHLNRLAANLVDRANAVFHDLDVKAQLTRGGSLFNIHFTDRPIRTVRDAEAGNNELRRALFFSLLNRGIYVALRGYGCISTPMTDREIDTFVDTLQTSMEEDILPLMK